MIRAFKNLLYILPENDKKKLIILFFLVFTGAVLELIGLLSIPLFILCLAQPEKLFHYPIIGTYIKELSQEGTKFILYAAIALLFVLIAKSVFLIFLEYIRKIYLTNRLIYLKQKLMNNYLNMDYSAFIKKNPSDGAKIINTDIDYIITYFFGNFIDAISCIVTTIIIVIFLFFFDIKITLLLSILIGGFGFLFLRFTRNQTNDLGHENHLCREKMNKLTYESLKGIKEIKILNRQNYFLQEYKNLGKILKRPEIFIGILNKVPKQLIELLAVFALLIITIIMTYQNAGIQEIIATISLFMISAYRLMPIVNQIVSYIPSMRYYIPLVDILYKEMQESSLNINYNYPALNNIPSIDTLRVKDIFFRYEEAKKMTINSVSLSISKGESIAFVGSSGAGKSTLVDIILGLLKPQKGSIEVDGQNIETILPLWQKNIGYIPQSIFISDDSIIHNVALGIPKDKIDENAFNEAIRFAQLESLLNELPEGKNTKIGDNGIRLSGGQRQRIGIARALYHKPKLIIMDEATSALDNLTENYIINAIESLHGTITTITIAHRITTVKKCDVIFILKEGAILESGSYDYLMNNSKEFQRMNFVSPH